MQEVCCVESAEAANQARLSSVGKTQMNVPVFARITKLCRSDMVQGSLQMVHFGVAVRGPQYHKCFLAGACSLPLSTGLLGADAPLKPSPRIDHRGIAPWTR
jgi:hypothetical protein